MSKRNKKLYLVHSQMEVERPPLQTVYGRMSSNIQSALHVERYLEAISLCELAMSHCLGVRTAWLQNGQGDNPQFTSINLLIAELTEARQQAILEPDQVATVLYAQVRDWYNDKCQMLPGLMMIGASAKTSHSGDPRIAALAEKGFFLWQLMAALMEHLNVQHCQQDLYTKVS